MAAASRQGSDQCIDVNFAQGPALRAPHTHPELAISVKRIDVTGNPFEHV